METNGRTQNDPVGDAPTPLPDPLLWGALSHLHLNIAQTAVLCGISVRQLGYWTKQGYVTASGRGARRMYGLDSLRRILAIKNAMTSGVSLRQALRALPETGAALQPPLPPSLEPGVTSPSVGAPQPPPPTAVRLSRQEVAALAEDLSALFAANPFTRDDASGLAVKVGRATADIRNAAEMLCARGLLLQTVSQGATVFESTRKDCA